MTRIILTSFLLTSLFLCKKNGNAQCHLNDWTALKALYESTNGNNWVNNSGWDVMIANTYNPPANCNLGTLFGISLNDAGRVNAVFLLANNLQGNIPNEIGKLSELDDLLLNYNYLTGEIPTEIGQLNSLITLGLDYNQLSGSIPSEIGSLTNLVNLQLSENNFVGQIPSSIGNLSKLENLTLHENQLTGEIPSSIGNLTNLSLLILAYNQLSGCYANELTQLCNQIPSELIFSPPTPIDPISQSNNFDATWKDFCATGNGACLPVASNCRQTDSLALIKIYESLNGENLYNLSTSIDTWEGVYLNSRGCVRELILSQKNLSGTIPSEIGDLSEVTFIDLYDNNITGNIPSQIGNLTNLETLGFGLNKLEGAIPSTISNLKSLEILDLNSNLLTEIPSSIDQLEKLEYLYLDYNLFTVIPSSIGDLTGLTDLSLSNNQIQYLPASIGNLSKLTNINAMFNKLTELPNSISQLSKLNFLQLTNNQITGELPAWLGGMDQLEILLVLENDLSGCYSTELKQLCTQLDAGFNNNYSISNGNNFDASWEDFCQSNLGACLQSPSTVSTNYSGNINVTVTTNENGKYILGNDNVKVIDYTTCDLTDIENCVPVNGFDNLAANEVLWTIEKATQYFEDIFNVSLPQVTAFVNSSYNSRPNSSTYSPNKKAIFYGIGDGLERTSMTAPDIVGHEFMHFVIENLNSEFCRYGECGALNESFSDIFGEVLEYICRGSNDWIYGSEVIIAANSGIRSLSNPKDAAKSMQNQLPNTYLGDNWILQSPTCIDDLCGIHTNNGVHNYWFYLLANGGAGINDNELTYKVEGIGIEKAAQIVFTNLFNNLTPTNTYTDAMYSSINMAKELYGENSNEVQQTIAAWEAVGLTVTQFNPINWMITDFVISGTEEGGAIPIQLDLNIDSLGQDIDADGLSFTLHLPKNYQLDVVNIYAPLTTEEVIALNDTINNEINVSINRQNAGVQLKRSIAAKIKSGAPILSVGGCVLSLDVDGDCGSFPPIEISGGTEVIENQIINFNSSTLLFGSDCGSNRALRRQNSNVADNLLNVALQLDHQSCANWGAMKVEIPNNTKGGVMPYHYYLFNQNGKEISNELNSSNLKHQFYNLEEGIYQLKVQDSNSRYFIKNFEVNFSAEMNGSACCSENLTVPPGEVTGFFNASNSISLKNGTIINVGEIDICD